jgi:zinc transport system substrate-binding protein
MILTRTLRAIIVLSVAVLLALASGYTLVKLLPAPEPPTRLTVVASFFPLKEFVVPLVGPDVRVRTLVPLGIEPHDWEPSPGDVRLISEADLVVYVHPDFETYVSSLLASVPEPPPAVVTSNGLDLLTVRRGDKEEVDPHIWLDPVLVQHQVRLIRDALIGVDPAFAEDYRARADAFIAELQALHLEIDAGLKQCEVRTFIASHAAFTYFSQRYNLTLKAISVDPELAPSPARLEELIDFALANNISVIYTEPLVGGGAAEAIAEAIGGITLPLDPVEGLSAEGEDPTYLSLMRDNLANLRAGLRCS